MNPPQNQTASATSQPAVTIVIPNYNDEATLAACVQSVLTNTEYADWNLIVVDDGSTDKSLQKLNHHPRLKIIRQTRQGTAAALNAGFAAAGNRDVVRLHADVVIETPNWLSQLVATVASQPKAGVVGVKLVYPDGRIQAEGRNIINGVGFHVRHRDRKAFAPDASNAGKPVEVDVVHGALAYYRREVITAVGGLDEKYGQVWTEDMDFCIAARFAGYKVYVDPAVRAIHYARCWGPASMIRIGGTENSLRQIAWQAKQQSERAQAKYWEAKWGWNPFFPDLNEIRRLYGHTEICWHIGEPMRYRPQTDTPTVDCCLVTANNLGLLRRCLESLAQTDYPFGQLKVYIADNGSTDGSLEYLDGLRGNYPIELIVNKLPLNTGVPVGLNWAVMQGQGELVARLDDDIVLPANWLKVMVQDLRHRPFAGCVGPKILNDDARKGIQCGCYRHFPGLYGHEDEADLGQADYLARTAHVRGCCNLYRRDVFAWCGFFDLRFSPSQFDDPDHHLAVAAAGFEILYEGRVNVIHKLNNGLARSHAAISNQGGNAQKMYGKWGGDIYEVLEKSIDLSREGRYLPDDGDTGAAWLSAPEAAAFPQRDVQPTPDSLEIIHVVSRELSSADCFTNINSMAAEHVKFAATQLRDGFPRHALDTLNSALNFAPQNVPTIEALAQTYLESGQPDMAKRIARHALYLAPHNAALQALVKGAKDTTAERPVLINLQDKSNFIGESLAAGASPGKLAGTARRMRVLMVNTFENRAAGGDMVQLKKTKQYLEKLGVEVDVCCSPRPDARGYDLVHIFNMWFPHQTLAQLKAIRLLTPNIPVVMSPIYWNMTEKAWADVAVPQIFANSTTAEELESRLKQLATDKLLVGGRRRSEASEPNFSGYTQYQLQIMDMVDYLLPLSNAEMLNLRQTLKVQKPFNVVPNGAEIEVFENAKPDWFVKKYKIRDFVLMVGLVEARKNQLMLLHALKDEGVPVVIVGRNYDPTYLRLCHKYAPDKTLFIDHLPHEQLASAFKAAQVHALPSWMECASLANIEAALAGCSLVVSDRTSEPEYYGKNAYYCDPASVDSIRRAVQSARRNRTADAPKREQLRQQFLTQYTWQSAAEKTLRGYEATLALRAPAGASKPVAVDISFKPAAEQIPTGGTTSPAPLVSIIIPTFNRFDLTQACLLALHAHTPTGMCELIIVDNASTDGTRNYLAAEQAAGRLTAVLNEQNAGFARACNQGAAVARGKYVLFLNNDTEVKPGWLEALSRTAEADARIGALGSKLLFSDGTIQHAGTFILDHRPQADPLLAHHAAYRQPADLPDANQPRTYQALTAACLCVRRDVFNQVKGFDQEFWNGYEDVDLCFKIQDAGYLLVYQPASVVLHHESQSGPERFRQARQNIARLHQKWLGKIQPDFIVDTDGKMAKTAANRINNYVAPAGAGAAPTVSIIMLALNQLEHTRLCLDSIAAHTTLPHEIILVDNGSTDGTPEFLKTWSAAHAGCTVIRNESNRGFAAGNNQGLAVARGEYVLLLNNDTIVTTGWLEAMLAVFAQQPGTGIVGPVSNRVSGPQLVRDAAYQTLPEMHAFAQRYVQANVGQSFEVVRAVGFCLLASRDVITQIGGLDESFGSGNFEDDDFCIRTQLAGFRIRVARDAFVHHTGSQTFAGEKIDYRVSMQRNWDIFRKKWELPAEVTLESGYPIPLHLPAKLTLNLAVPPLTATHTQAGNHWTEKKKVRLAALPIKPAAVAEVGRLNEARELFAQKDFAAAWAAALTAMAQRPFHPEAGLLLAEIALAAGDGQDAKVLAQRTRDLAPGWSRVKQFLTQPLKGNARPAWLDIAGFTPPAARLTVCVIVKNEEPFIAQCLKSVHGFASQIIVVDTGSTDRTVEIAREFGAQIHSFNWCDDFAAARNAALEHATGDWVLMLDADEELPPAQHAKLLADMKAGDIIARRLPLVNVGRESEGRSVVPRLFRNAPGVFFHGRIHEQVFASLLVQGKKWGLATALGTAELLHYGYTKELVVDRNKVERNLKLLQLALAENPTDVNLVMNLGLELVRSDNLAAGLEKYREAYELMAVQPEADLVPELREVLFTQFTSQLYKVRAHAEVVRLLTSPLARHGSGLTASLHFSLGLSYFELKQYREAADQMRLCWTKRKQPALTPINTDILTAAPQHCLALCLAKLEDPAGAEAVFKIALAETGHVEAAKLDYAKFLLAADRAVEALTQLNEIVGQNNQNVAAWKLGGEIALSQAGFLEFAGEWTGEAVKALPEHPALATQRAEALMLNGHAADAAALWGKLWSSEPQARSLAALILCELIESPTTHAPDEGEEESATSLAFIEWYQKLIAVRAGAMTSKINDQLEKLGRALPMAAQMLGTALTEAAVPECDGQ